MGSVNQLACSNQSARFVELSRESPVAKHPLAVDQAPSPPVEEFRRAYVPGPDDGDAIGHSLEVQASTRADVHDGLVNTAILEGEGLERHRRTRKPQHTPDIRDRIAFTRR